MSQTCTQSLYFVVYSFCLLGMMNANRVSRSTDGECPEPYKKYYCLNNSKCLRISNSYFLEYACECAHGYVGRRCEFKQLSESIFMPTILAKTTQAHQSDETVDYESD
ncbi:hypothetical protein HDE_11764 [Halotydeus destructor]|nr:hypothetical protein HDE_11764 [Halotydeus destructor]